MRLERAGNRGERRVQARTNALHGSDDHNGNARRDQAVFNSRRTGLVLEEPRYKILHNSLHLFDTLGWPAGAAHAAFAWTRWRDYACAH